MSKYYDEGEVIHQDIVSDVKSKLIQDETLDDLAEFFKVLGDFTRVKILSCLAIKEMCVCDVAGALNMTKSAVSHQLRILRQSKLVKARKSGKEVYYSLDDDHVNKIFECGLSHVNE